MRTVILMLALVFASSSCWAVEWYVSGGGNDRNNGRATGTAFRNLSKASGVVNAGDTVWVMNGSYTSFNLTRSGTAAARITFKAYPGHAPEVRSRSWNTISVNASYQTIDGLILTGPNDSITLAQAEADYKKGSPNGLYNTNGITLDNRGKATKHHYLTVRNCTVRKFSGGGIATIEADFTVIENCKVYECAWYSQYGCSGITIFPHNAAGTVASNAYRNIIRGNTVWNNRGLVKWKQIGAYSDGNGVIIDVTATNYHGRTLVSDNLVVNNGGSGIHGFKARRLDIINNTAYQNGQKVGYADIYAGYSTDVRILNNIMSCRNGGKANTNTANAQVVYNFNVYFNGTRAVTGANDIVDNPDFENPGLNPLTADFRLKPGSPALNTGVVITGVTSTRDINGVNRPQGTGIDRGAYERIAGGTTPPDTTPPATPAAPATTSTSSPTPTLSGTTEANATVRIYRNAVLVRTQIANGNGAWSWTVTPALAVGSHSFTVDVRDAAGNTSSRSAALVITVADTTPPTTPAAPLTTSNTNATPTLSGTTEAGATIRIYRNNTLVHTQTASGTGAWSWIVTPALAEGIHNFTVTATDVARNTSGRSPACVITVPDTTPPGTPAAPNATSLTTATPTLSGTTEANAKVRIYRNGTLDETVTANAAGAWSSTVTPALTPGVSYAFTVTASDAAGNTSARSPARTITPTPPVDSIPPTKPAAPNASSLTSATPILTGTTEPGALIRIFRNNTYLHSLGTNATTGAWSWTVTPALGVGPHAITVSATDAEDNTSARSDATTITITVAPDTTPPTKPAAPAADDDTSATPTLSGTTEPGATVTIFVDGEEIHSLPAGTDGTWSWIVTPALPQGTHAITVTSTDLSGNDSAASEETTITVLTTDGGSDDHDRSSDGGGKKCGLGGGVAAFAAMLMTMFMRLRLRR